MIDGFRGYESGDPSEVGQVVFDSPNDAVTAALGPDEFRVEAPGDAERDDTALTASPISEAGTADQRTSDTADARQQVEAAFDDLTSELGDGDEQPDEAQSSEHSVEKAVTFAEDIVQRALTEARAADIIKAEYSMMQETRKPVAGLHERLFEARPTDIDDREGTSRAVGFALAHRILRYAAEASGRDLPLMSDELIRNYQAYAKKVPAILEADFLRDYSEHKAVRALLDGFSNDHSREGAMFMFNLHGRLANPKRGDVLIPRRDDALESNFQARPERSRRGFAKGDRNQQISKRRR